MPFYDEVLKKAKNAKSDDICPCCGCPAEDHEDEENAALKDMSRNGITCKRGWASTPNPKDRRTRNHLGILDAAAQDNREMAKMLKKIKPEDIQQLEKASKKGDVEAVRNMVGSGRLGFSGSSGKNTTPVFLHLALAEAASAGHTLLVKYLVKEVKCDPDREAPGMGHKPLGLAALSDFPDTVEELINLRADPNARDSSRRSPLSLASGAGHLKVVQKLMVHASNREWEINDHEGLRSEIQEVQISSSMISDGIMEGFRNRIVEDPICAAAMQDRRDVVEFLFEKCKPSDRTIRWMLAFACAPISGGTDTLDLLVKKWQNKEVLPKIMDEDAVILSTLVGAARRCNGKMEVLQFLVPAFRETLKHREAAFNELLIAAFTAYLVDPHKANNGQPTPSWARNNPHALIEKVIFFFVVECNVNVPDILDKVKSEVTSKKVRDSLQNAVLERERLHGGPNAARNADQMARELIEEEECNELKKNKNKKSNANNTQKGGKKKKKKLTKEEKRQKAEKQAQLEEALAQTAEQPPSASSHAPSVQEEEASVHEEEPVYEQSIHEDELCFDEDDVDHNDSISNQEINSDHESLDDHDDPGYKVLSERVLGSFDKSILLQESTQCHDEGTITPPDHDRHDIRSNSASNLSRRSMSRQSIFSDSVTSLPKFENEACAYATTHASSSSPSQEKNIFRPLPPVCPPPAPPDNHMIVNRAWFEEDFSGPSQLAVEAGTMIEFFPERKFEGWLYCQVLGHEDRQGWLPYYCFDDPPGHVHIVEAD